MHQYLTLWTDRRTMMENKLNGNAAAGTLQAIFPFEMTLMRATCTGGGNTKVIGATAAYMHGMGTVIRCPSCDTVLVRIVHARERYLLDTRPCNTRRVVRPSDTCSEH
jgi:Family of unknown function (DUF6510)